MFRPTGTRAVSDSSVIPEWEKTTTETTSRIGSLLAEGLVPVTHVSTRNHFARRSSAYHLASRLFQSICYAAGARAYVLYVVLWRESWPIIHIYTRQSLGA